MHFNDSNLTVEKVLQSIDGKEPITQLLIFKDSLVNFPLVLKIREQADFVIVEAVDKQNNIISYRKTSETAGIQ